MRLTLRPKKGRVAAVEFETAPRVGDELLIVDTPELYADGRDEECTPLWTVTGVTHCISENKQEGIIIDIKNEIDE